MAVPKINRAWTVLSKADYLMWETAPYVRKTTPQLFSFTGPEYKIDALVPYGDNLLRAYQIEQLIQVVLRSSLRERLLAMDPVNTYMSANLEYPTPGLVTGNGLPADVRVQGFYTEQSFINKGSGDVKFTCVVDPTGLTVAVDVNAPVAFTYVNQLTSNLEMSPGFEIQLKGDLGVSSFTFPVQFIASPRIQWRDTLHRAQNTQWDWTDVTLKNMAETDPLWTNKLAAYVISAIEDNLNG